MYNNVDLAVISYSPSFPNSGAVYWGVNLIHYGTRLTSGTRVRLDLCLHGLSQQVPRFEFIGQWMMTELTLRPPWRVRDLFAATALLFKSRFLPVYYNGNRRLMFNWHVLTRLVLQWHSNSCVKRIKWDSLGIFWMELLESWLMISQTYSSNHPNSFNWPCCSEWIPVL